MAKESLWKATGVRESEVAITVGTPFVVECVLKDDVSKKKLADITSVEVTPESIFTFVSVKKSETNEKCLEIEIIPEVAMEDASLTISFSTELTDVVVEHITVLDAPSTEEEVTPILEAQSLTAVGGTPVTIQEESVQFFGIDELMLSTGSTFTAQFFISDIPAGKENMVSEHLNIREVLDRSEVTLQLKDVAVAGEGVVTGNILITNTAKEDMNVEIEMYLEESSGNMHKKAFLQFKKGIDKTVVPEPEEEPLIWTPRFKTTILKNLKGVEIPMLEIVDDRGREVDEDFEVVCSDPHITVNMGVIQGKFPEAGEYTFRVNPVGKPTDIKECKLTIEPIPSFTFPMNSVELDVTRKKFEDVPMPIRPAGYESINFTATGDKWIIKGEEISRTMARIYADVEGSAEFAVTAHGFLVPESKVIGKVYAKVTDLAKQEAEEAKKALLEKQEQERRKAEEERKKKLEEEEKRFQAEQIVLAREEKKRKREILVEDALRERLGLPWIQTEYPWVVKLMKGSGDPRLFPIDFKKDYYGWISGRNCVKAMEEWKIYKKERDEKEMGQKMTTKPIIQQRTWDDDLITNAINMANDVPRLKTRFRVEGNEGKKIFSWSDARSPLDSFDLTMNEVREMYRRGYRLGWLEGPRNLPKPYWFKTYYELERFVLSAINSKDLQENL